MSFQIHSVKKGFSFLTGHQMYKVDCLPRGQAVSLSILCERTIKARRVCNVDKCIQTRVKEPVTLLNGIRSFRRITLQVPLCWNIVGILSAVVTYSRFNSWVISRLVHWGNHSDTREHRVTEDKLLCSVRDSNPQSSVRALKARASYGAATGLAAVVVWCVWRYNSDGLNSSFVRLISRLRSFTSKNYAFI
jgi:lysozyme family protein